MREPARLPTRKCGSSRFHLAEFFDRWRYLHTHTHTHTASRARRYSDASYTIARGGRARLSKEVNWKSKRNSPWGGTRAYICIHIRVIRVCNIVKGTRAARSALNVSIDNKIYRARAGERGKTSGGESARACGPL